jgi:hypothetical protein
MRFSLLCLAFGVEGRLYPASRKSQGASQPTPLDAYLMVSGIILMSKLFPAPAKVSPALPGDSLFFSKPWTQNGLLPIRSADQVAFRAFGFRRCLSNNLNPHRLTMPSRMPRKPSSSAKGASIITCACSGAKEPPMVAFRTCGEQHDSSQ